MFGLRRIIQIDGFIPSLRTVVELDGHSIINGTNGAGKSSTLKLLPFFYGSDPSRLDSHAAGRDPFVQFYLPRQTSLIIFEYLRESGLCCAVVYRHRSGNKHVYRFLESGFTEERFSQTDSSGKSTYCKGHELKFHWKQLGLTSSQQIELVADYRAIIQNDSMLINRLANSKSLRQLAGNYCLGSRKTHMRYIERVCAAIMSRSGNMERMKDMLADIMVEDGVIFPASPIHRDDSSIAKEISSLRMFEKEIPRMKEALSRHKERLHTEAELKSYGGQVKQAELDLSEEVEKTDSTLKVLEEQLVMLQQEWFSSHERLDLQRIEARNEVRSCDNKIQNLQNQYEAYENNGMDQKSSDFDKIPRYVEEAEEKRARYQRLIEDVGEEENALNRNLNVENDRFNGTRNSVQKKLDTAQNALRIEEQKHATKRELVLTQEHSEIEATRKEAAPARDKLTEERALAKATVSSGGSNEAERGSLAEIDQKIEDLDLQVEKSRRLSEQKQSIVEDAKKDRDEAQETLDKAKNSLRSKEKDLEQHHKITFAESGTWLSRLREKDPEWVKRVAKVVDPDLLQRKDLHAEFIGEELDSIFGWSINLEAIASSKLAESEEQLRAEYATLEDAVRRSKDHVSQCEASCDKANKLVKSCEEEFSSARISLQHFSNQKDQAQISRKARQRSINEAVATRRQEAIGDVKRLDQEIRDSNKNLKVQIEAIKSRHSEGRSELESAWGIEKYRLEEGIAAFTNDLDGLSETHKSKKRALEEDFNKACSSKGIDSNTVESAKQDANEAQTKLHSIRDSGPEVNQYRQWLKSEWQDRSELTDSLARFKSQREKIETKIRDSTRKHKQAKEVLAKDKSKTSKELVRLKTQMGEITNLRPSFSYYMETATAIEPSMPFDLLLQNVLSLVESNTALKDRLVNDIHAINNTIVQLEGTQLAKAWQHAKDNLRQELGFDDPFDRNFLINLPQALEIFIYEEVKSIKLTHIELLRATAKGLTDFFGKLQVIHNKIRDQSKKITASISENMKIDALSSMQMSLTSRIDSLDYWSSLKGFSEGWDNWRESGERGLPDQQFLDEMTALINGLQSIKSGHLRDYFDLQILMVENGHARVIKNDHQLDNSTSDGLKYLALCVIFIAISRQLCQDKSVELHWPIDELGILHGENISRLFGMLNQGGIIMVGGFPSEDPVMLRHFKHRQVIDFKKGIRVIDIPKSSLRERALAHRDLGVVNA